MNKNQKLFLSELHKLCEKYNIDEILIFSGRIVFKSANSQLGFISYSNEIPSFNGIYTTEDNFLIELRDSYSD